MQYFAIVSPHISVRAEEVASIFGVSITNSHVLGALGLIILVLLFLHTVRVANGKQKSTFVSRLMTWAFSGLYRTVEQVIPDPKWARRVAPLVITIFFFVVAQYWLGLLPIVGPITVQNASGVTLPLMRGGVADLNMTFGLAIITMVAAQVYAFKYLGFQGSASRYFTNPFKNPIMSFVGVLELIAELSRLLGLSFRLFGNVLAGEVLLIMIAFLTNYLSPIALQPFYLFELFIGGIQAYIFFMLSTVFISLGLSHHGDDGEKQTHSEKHPSPAEPIMVGGE